MVEAGASQLSEEVVLGAILFAHTTNQQIIALQDRLVAEAGTAKMPWQAADAEAAPIPAVTPEDAAVAEEAVGGEVVEAGTEAVEETPPKRGRSRRGTTLSIHVFQAGPVASAAVQ